MLTHPISRRTLLRGAGALGLGLALGGYTGVEAALHGRRGPDSLPDPSLPEGTDTLPQIEHVVVLMMENHSFDSYFGVLGRGHGFHLRGGQPSNANPDADGNLVHAFHMPSTCQLDGEPSQNWNSSHLSLM